MRKRPKHRNAKLKRPEGCTTNAYAENLALTVTAHTHKKNNLEMLEEKQRQHFSKKNIENDEIYGYLGR